MIVPRTKLAKMEPEDLERAVASLSPSVAVTVIEPGEEGGFQGRFDVIIHKVTYDLARAGDPEAERRVEGFLALCARNPSARVVDPIDSIHRIMKRSSMYAVLDGVRGLAPLPHARVKAGGSVREALASRPIPMPLIIKTDLAAGLAVSHSMAIVRTLEQAEAFFRSAAADCVLQAYSNHGGVIYKVYVIGDWHHLVARHSTPNCSTDGDAVAFDSQLYIKQIQGEVPRATPPTEAYLQALTHELSAQLGLSLYGYDLIRDETTGQYHCIDINFFPGFSGVPRYWEKILKL